MLDVLIIGGGPAGSTLAWALRHAGLRIAIMDKESFPRQKVCAGWVTPAVMQELEIDLDAYAGGRILQPVNGFRIGLIGQKQVQSSYPGEPVSYGIRRIEFDHYLLQRCQAELRTGEAFERMERTDYGWCVNGAIEARLVIGAGGHFCPVARAIGAKGVSELAVAAQEVEFEMTAEQLATCNIDARVPELFFTPDLKGYGWVFRKQNYLNIGLGREDKHKLTSHVQTFIRYLKQQSKVPHDMPEKLNGHAYLLYPHAIRNIVSDNVLLIGDAAGLAYAQSGEGIRPAVESAILAAGVVENCALDFSAAQLHSYQERIEQRFGQRHPKPSTLEHLPLGIKQLIASALMKTDWFTRKIVTDRWFLHSDQHPLNSASASTFKG
jgi:geranylgeranyl reductase family protein